MLRFMDDNRHYVNNFKQSLLKYLLKILEKSVRTLNELLNFVGSQLEIKKSLVFNKTGLRQEGLSVY